jgi:hypothetical protein
VGEPLGKEQRLEVGQQGALPRGGLTAPGGGTQQGPRGTGIDVGHLITVNASVDS